AAVVAGAVTAAGLLATGWAAGTDRLATRGLSAVPGGTFTSVCVRCTDTCCTALACSSACARLLESTGTTFCPLAPAALPGGVRRGRDHVVGVRDVDALLDVDVLLHQRARRAALRVALALVVHPDAHLEPVRVAAVLPALVDDDAVVVAAAVDDAALVAADAV